MKKLLFLLLATALLLAGCSADPVPTTTVPPQTTVPETTVPETTIPETTVPVTTAPVDKIPLPENCSLEDLLVYWDEVVLQMEYSDGTGDPSLIQKWLYPIVCRVEGEPTDEDLRVLAELFDQLNQIPGFPGISMAEGLQQENLTLSFLGPEEFRDRFSAVVGGGDAWGATQFWYYTATNEIYTAQIGYRTDIDQLPRNSILLEEIINTLGVSDTVLREDSIVYQYSDANLQLSDTDWLILKLLYHPDMHCGMDAAASHAVIESLYQ